MRGFFEPRSVAVVGVSDNPDNLGRTIVKNLQEFSCSGIIYLVGPRGGIQFGRRIYKSVADIPDQVDLAVILTPARTVPDVLEECGAKGIKRAVIESAGFGEYGEEGKKLETRLKEIAAKYDMRFIGPNCIGVINMHNGLVVPFAPFKDVYNRGGISLISQSGGVGISYLSLLASEALGVCKFASIGNKLDVDENDLLEYFLQDDDTEIICMYLEGISNGKRLMQLARSSKKPILIHKSNIGGLAKNIASSHTAALTDDDSVVDAALKQAGIARFRESETLLNYLKILPMPRPKGNKLAVMSRSGGHAVMAADACDLAGFDLAPFPDEFVREIEKHLRAKVIKLTNPLDLGDLFDTEMYIKIAERTLRQENVDALVFLHTYVSETEGSQSRDLFNTLAAMSRKFEKPVVICVATDAEEQSRLRRSIEYPLFTEPQDAINALALARDFGTHANRIEGTSLELDADSERVRKILDVCKDAKRSPQLMECLEILDAYGIPVSKSIMVHDVDEAVQKAKDLSLPVALKVVSEQVSHKSDIGGVQLNLRNPEAIRNAYNEIMDRVREHAPDANVSGVLLQPMAPPGRELILGGKQDRNFGPVVLAGLGGIFVEIFADVSMRIAPFPGEAAREMLLDLEGSPILTGARGQKAVDLDIAADAIMRLAKLLMDFSDISEIDINPFRMLTVGKGAVALDARIVIK
ncbi:MAG: acetate--CoA ligase family protein [Deltaproteobacteria bacterium]|nr:acetate--CoA ligase family protein [Deltaproteobacteria bacterium]